MNVFLRFVLVCIIKVHKLKDFSMLLICHAVMKFMPSKFMMFISALSIMSCFAEPSILYLDNGTIYFCKRGNDPNVIADVHSWDVAKGDNLRHEQLSARFPMYHPDCIPVNYANAFPLSWYIAKEDMCIVYPDFACSADGTINIMLRTIKKSEGIWRAVRNEQKPVFSRKRITFTFCPVFLSPPRSFVSLCRLESPRF